MSAYTATVIKSGNSYALRVPKSYIDQGKVRPGDKVVLSDARKAQSQDMDKMQAALKALQKSDAFKGIKDPVAWQRAQRKDRPLPGRESR